MMPLQNKINWSDCFKTPMPDQLRLQQQQAMQNQQQSLQGLHGGGIGQGLGALGNQPQGQSYLGDPFAAGISSYIAAKNSEQKPAPPPLKTRRCWLWHRWLAVDVREVEKLGKGGWRVEPEVVKRCCEKCRVVQRKFSGKWIRVKE